VAGFSGVTNQENKTKLAIRCAYSKGYKVLRSGILVTPSGLRTLGRLDDGYMSFTVSTSTGKRRVRVHRLVAYQKYGEAAMGSGIVTRHKNNIPTDNRWSNILIGTNSDNMMDRPAEDRVDKARNAASYLRKLTPKQVRDIRKKRKGGAKYSELCTEYSIRKSTLSYVINRITYADVI
jgi:hypothetical protein